MLRLIYHPIQWGRRQYSRRIAAASTTKLKFDVLLTNSTADTRPYSCSKRLRSSSSSYQCNSIQNSCVYNSSVNVDGDSKVKEVHLQQSQFSCNKLSFSLQLPLHCNTQVQSQSLQSHSRCYTTSSSRKYLPFEDCQTVEELVQLIYDNMNNSTPRNIATFWTLVSKLLRKIRFEKVQNIEQMNHQLNDILVHTLQDINTFGSRDLSTTAISIGKIVKNVSGTDGKRLPRYGTPQRILHDLIIGDKSSNKEFIFKILAEPSMIILHKFEARHLSNLIYAYGLAEYVIKFDDGSTLFDVFAQAAIPNLHTFNGQDLSNMLWSYANVKVPNSTLFEKVGDCIVQLNNLDEFWPQALSNSVWAYATLNEKHPKLFKQMADHIISLDGLDNFIPQALSNTLWAFATSEVPHPQLFKRIGNHIIQLDTLDKFKPQHLSNILWAFATAEESHPQLFKKVVDHIVTLPSLRMFNGQDCSNTLWAIATAGESHPHLFERLADHIIELPNLNGFKSQALSNTVWAYSTAGESNPQLFNKLADEAIKRQCEFIDQGLVNFLWAYATNGQVDKHLFSSLVPSVKDNLDKYNAQGLINVAWAYLVANVNAPSIFNNEFINACLGKEEGFTVKALAQLHQWQLWQKEIKLPSSLQKKCYEAFISDDPTPSKFQDDVVSILLSMGLQPQEEVLLKCGYRIDAVVEVNGKQIAVEVDGPSHFIGRSRDLTGSTILKKRQVAALDGMNVVSVPYWEWDKLKKDSKKKEKYLNSLLGTCV